MDEVSSHVRLGRPYLTARPRSEIVPPRPRNPMMEGPPGADSEEKHEPVSDIDTVVVDSLKALDPEWPIREADMLCPPTVSRFVPLADVSRCSKLCVYRRIRPAEPGAVWRAALDRR